MSPTKSSLLPAEWPSRFGIVPSLDGIRALSVMIVLVGHMLLPVSMVGVSALGLKTFFFISGFLITRLLLAESKLNGSISLPAFYARRFLRLYPVIIVYVVLTSIVVLARGQSINPIEVLSVFGYFVNYLVVYYDHLGQSMTLPIGILWSLSVEEHFYLLAPLALVLLRGDGRKMLPVAVAICVASLALRLIYAARQPWVVDTLEIYWRSETRFDSIAFGVLLACLTEFSRGRQIIDRLRTPPAFIAGAVVLLVSYAIRDHYFQNTWRFTVQGLALMPLVATVVFGQSLPVLNRVLNIPALAWIGALSYSLYVWHAGVSFLFGAWFAYLPHSVAPFVELAIAFVLATISYYAVERPLMNLRKRFGHGVAKHRTAPAPLQKPEAGAQTGLT